MTIIVTETSSTSCSLTAQHICRDALEHLGIIGAGETMSPEDLSVALRGLGWLLAALRT